MKDKIKKIILGYLPGFITGIIICGSISVIAATYFPSNDVTYNNKESGLESTDVQGAIDELYGVCAAEPSAGEQIIEDAGLEKDPYECRYFFVGANPNNYITFNGETAGWRIISVECDGTIKIMRINDINTDNILAWDDYNYNDWSRPVSLNTYLNGTYYNGLNIIVQNQIVAQDFSVGSVVIDKDLESQVNDENSKVWRGKIALPTLSEYLRTNSNLNCKTFRSYNDNFNTCKNTTWMYTSKYPYFWTLSSQMEELNFVFYINGLSGNITSYDARRSTAAVMPTLYLSSDVEITGGDGSQSNPYEISL